MSPRWKAPARLETVEQQELVAWCECVQGRHPELRDLYAIPNGSYKSPAMAARFQREGLRSGVPDLHLPHARGGFLSLYVEMKRTDATDRDVSPAQRDWHERLRAAGHRVEVCKGFEAARVVLLDYLALPARRSESAA